MRRLLEHPHLLRSLTFSSTSLFCRIALCPKERLSWHCSPGVMFAPVRLPSYVLRFLSSALGVPTPLIEECWTIFGDIIWFADPVDDLDSLRSKELLDIFDVHGAPEGICE